MKVGPANHNNRQQHTAIHITIVYKYKNFDITVTYFFFLCVYEVCCSTVLENYEL